MPYSLLDNICLSEHLHVYMWRLKIEPFLGMCFGPNLGSINLR